MSWRLEALKYDGVYLLLTEALEHGNWISMDFLKPITGRTRGVEGETG